jgi:hypothetical protein
MFDLYKIIFTSIISFIVSIITYRYQFARNQKLDSKKKLILLNEIIIDSLSYLDNQIECFLKFIEISKNGNSEIPILTVNASNDINILKEKLHSDECFYAYYHILSDNIKSKDVYFDLRKISIAIDLLINQMIDMHKEARGKNKETLLYIEKQYSEIYKQILLLHNSNELSGSPVFESISKLVNNWLTINKNRNKEDDTRNKINDFFKPLINIISNSQESKLLSFSFLIVDTIQNFENSENRRNYLIDSFKKQVLQLEELRNLLDGHVKVFRDYPIVQYEIM